MRATGVTIYSHAQHSSGARTTLKSFREIRREILQQEGEVRDFCGYTSKGLWEGENLSWPVTGRVSESFWIL